MATSWEVTVVFENGTDLSVNSDTEPNIIYESDGLVGLYGIADLPYVNRGRVLYVYVEKHEEVEA